MKYDIGLLFTVLMIGIVALYSFLKNANEWFCVKKLDKSQCILPPGDLGWPYIGNMLSFIRSYKYGDPESFISSFTTRYGNGGMYKAFMYGKPSIIITTPETCRQKEEPIELLTEMRKYASHVIMTIIMGTKIDQKWFDMFGTEFAVFVDGIFALPVDLPGFSYHRALKARENLVKIFQLAIDERRVTNASDKSGTKRSILDLLLESKDEEGRKFSEEKIANILILYSSGGQISTGPTATWALLYLQEHPEYLQKAKEEQEDIVKRRPSSQTSLTLSEIRQMKYLSKVIDETLRLVNASSPIFREATSDVKMSDYTIPQGWKVLVWTRNLHMDPHNYPNPKEFNPSRWDDHETKPGQYLPFGAGRRFCPGADLARLEISVLLHYFLLNYRLERLSKSKVQYFPTIRHTDNCLARIRKLSAENV
ncbi:putative expansin-like B1-like [Capsicum annuum]|nr:putative expansin-like B1-like [Capsicum annuum]